MRNVVPILLAVSLFPLGCISTPQPKPARVRRGDVAMKPGKMVLFRPQCTGAAGPCEGEFSSTLVGRLRSELEFHGFQVIDGDDLLATTRRSVSAGGHIEGLGPLGEYWSTAAASAESKVTYRDLPPAGRRALLEEAGAQGVVVLSVLVGDDQGPAPWYDLHDFELTARFTVGKDEALGLVVGCHASGESRDVADGIGVSFNQAADKLALCVAEHLP